SPTMCPTSPPAAAPSWSSSRARPCRRSRRWKPGAADRGAPEPHDAPPYSRGPGAAAPFSPGFHAPRANGGGVSRIGLGRNVRHIRTGTLSMSEHRRRTRILATLGPATDPPEVLEGILRAGVNVVRLNFSHGDPSSQVARAEAVREAAQRVGVEVGILADLPGPKIRVERFAEGKVALKAGDRFDLVADANAPLGSRHEVGVSYLGLPGDLVAGDALMLDDGMVQLQLERIEGPRIITAVRNDSVLSDRKGLNKLGGGLSLGALTERDRELIGVAAGIGVDFI